MLHRAEERCYRPRVVLTEWDDIADLIAAIFLGVMALVGLAGYLERRLSRPARKGNTPPRRKP